ncbi:MAG: alpha/beta fold hydrolase [Firmicutes bacterium]|nr:alpha/beta fold hydrolase [Bacillota bacterium]
MDRLFFEKEIYADCEGGRVFALCYVPEGKGPFPTIVLAHGFAGSYRDNLNCAERYVKEGFAVCSLDFRGGSPESRSGGDTRRMSVITEKADMLAVFERVLEEDFADKDRMILWGESLGGFVAALCAAELKERAAAAVLFYPAFMVQDEGKRLYGSREAVDMTNRRDLMELGPCFYTDVWDLDIYGEIGKYEGPVLLLHGTEDDLVPPVYSRKALAAYKDAELTMIEGAGHGFYDKTGELADRITADFLKRRLNIA